MNDSIKNIEIKNNNKIKNNQNNYKNNNNNRNNNQINNYKNNTNIKNSINNNKKEIIINAAIEILKNSNYYNMKTSEIAKIANVAEGTLYRYFKNKKDIFIETIRYVNNKFLDILLSEVSSDKTLEQNLKSIGKVFFKFQEEINTYYSILYKSFSEVDDRELKREIFNVYQIGITKVKDIIIDGMKKINLAYDEKKVEIMLMMLWGFGDIYWKRINVDKSLYFDEKYVQMMIDIVKTFLIL